MLVSLLLGTTIIVLMFFSYSWWWLSCCYSCHVVVTHHHLMFFSCSCCWSLCHCDCFIVVSHRHCHVDVFYVGCHDVMFVSLLLGTSIMVLIFSCVIDVVCCCWALPSSFWCFACDHVGYCVLLNFCFGFVHNIWFKVMEDFPNDFDDVVYSIEPPLEVDCYGFS